MYQYIQKVSEYQGPVSTLRDVHADRALLFGYFNDDKPYAYIVVEPHGVEAVILQAYSTKRECSKKLFNFTCDWLREHNFKRVSGYTDRAPDAWERAFGTHLIKYKIGKELMTDGEQA